MITKEKPGALAGATRFEFYAGQLRSVRAQDGEPPPSKQAIARLASGLRTEANGFAHRLTFDHERLHEAQFTGVRFEDFGYFSLPKIVRGALGQGWFDEADHIEPALILPATDQLEITDLCAVGLESFRIGLLHGNAWALGENELEHARRHDLAVHVFATPFAWWWSNLDRPAMCDLDWDRASFELAKQKIVAPSKRAGEILRERLALGPEIFIPREVAA